MIGRRGVRAAAVLMAGLVGAALVVPGLASAQTSTTTPAAACGADGAPVGGDLFCTPASSSTTAPSATTPPETVTPGSTTTSVPAAPLPGIDDLFPAGTPSSTSTEPPAPRDTATAAGAASPAAARSLLVSATSSLQEELTAAQTESVTNPLAVGDPTSLLTPAQLAAFFPAGVPTTVPTGGFTNPQQACAFFGSQLTSADTTGTLGAQFAGFCSSLPTSFGTDGLTSLTELINALTGLLGALPQGLPAMSGTATATTPAAYTAPEFMPYFSGSGANIYNCGDLDQATAQALLAQDPSDPNRLDANRNGVACEAGVSGVAYGGYPQGGVATGDSAPLVDAANAGSLALALVMTSGFAAAGAARRRDRDAEVAGV